MRQPRRATAAGGAGRRRALGRRTEPALLDVLARRIEDLPALLAIGARPGERTEDGLLDALAAAPAAHVVAPGSLSDAGVAALPAAALGTEPDEEFVRMCASATRGNPFLLRELARTLASSGFTGAAAETERASSAVPGNVTRMVVARLRRISPEAPAVARGVAVLGERGTTAQVASLIGLPVPDVREGAAVLVRAGLMEPDGLRFVHPLVREAVVSDLPVPARSSWHRFSARASSRGSRSSASSISALAWAISARGIGGA